MNEELDKKILEAAKKQLELTKGYIFGNCSSYNVAEFDIVDDIVEEMKDDDFYFRNIDISINGAFKLFKCMLHNCENKNNVDALFEKVSLEEMCHDIMSETAKEIIHEISGKYDIKHDSYYILERFANLCCIKFVDNFINRIRHGISKGHEEDLVTETWKVLYDYIAACLVVFYKYQYKSIMKEISEHHAAMRQICRSELDSDIIFMIDEVINYFQKIQVENIKLSLQFQHVYKRIMNDPDNFTYRDLYEFTTALKRIPNMAPTLSGIDEILDSYNVILEPVTEPIPEEDWGKEGVFKDSKGNLVKRVTVTDESVLMSSEYIVSFIKRSGLLDILKNVIINYQQFVENLANNRAYEYYETALDGLCLKTSLEVGKPYGYSIKIVNELECIIDILS